MQCKNLPVLKHSHRLTVGKEKYEFIHFNLNHFCLVVFTCISYSHKSFLKKVRCNGMYANLLRACKIDNCVIDLYSRDGSRISVSVK